MSWLSNQKLGSVLSCWLRYWENARSSIPNYWIQPFTEIIISYVQNNDQFFSKVDYLFAIRNRIKIDRKFIVTHRRSRYNSSFFDDLWMNKNFKIDTSKSTQNYHIKIKIVRIITGYRLSEYSMTFGYRTTNTVATVLVNPSH